MDDSKLRDVCLHLIKINQETFHDAEYDIAYHALNGALHSAERLKDLNYLIEVKRSADEQFAWIDVHDPGYEHSRGSMADRKPWVFRP